MTVDIGTRIGPQEIIAPLGAGGMGEVYRARDARLDRDVAIKMLTATFVGDRSGSRDERVRRFEQEARAADDRNVWTLHAAKSLPQFQPLRGDPRFGAFVRRLGMDPS